MANYAIRVELRGDPSYETYEKLHALMKNNGFDQRIKGLNGMSSLPHATYYGSSTSECTSVRDTLQAQIKSKIQQEIIVFVAEVQTWALGW